jgi:SH3-like domain-containing protein
LGAGALARVLKRRDGWLLVSANDAKGWMRAGAAWGGVSP